MPRRTLSPSQLSDLASPWVSPRTGRTLSPAQQRRYVGAGLTKSEYESGASVAAARGHKNETAERKRRKAGEYQTPWIKRAKDRGILEVIPNFNKFSREVQENAAKAYLGAFFHKDFKRNPEIKNMSFKDYADIRDYMATGIDSEGYQVINEESAFEQARQDYNRHVGFVLHGPSWSPSGR